MTFWQECLLWGLGVVAVYWLIIWVWKRFWDLIGEWDFE